MFPIASVYVFDLHRMATVDMDDIMEVNPGCSQAALYASPSVTRDFATEATSF